MLVLRIIFALTGIFYVSTSCVATTRHSRNVLYYSLKVRGDDALTISLVNALKRARPGFKYAATYQPDSGIVIYIRNHLRFIEGSPANYAAFDVNFLQGPRVIGSLTGRCRVKDIRHCRNLILNRLREISNG